MACRSTGNIFLSLFSISNVFCGYRHTFPIACLPVCIEHTRRTSCPRVRTTEPQNFTIWQPTPIPPQLKPMAKQIIGPLTNLADRLSNIRRMPISAPNNFSRKPKSTAKDRPERARRAEPFWRYWPDFAGVSSVSAFSRLAQSSTFIDFCAGSICLSRPQSTLPGATSMKASAPSAISAFMQSTQ